MMLLCATVVFSVNAKTKGFEKSVEANVNIGLDDCLKYSFGINILGGYRVNCFYIGAGVGYSYINGLYYSNYEYMGKGDSYSYNSFDIRNNLNLFARAKINFTKTKISPFLLIDLGGTLGLSSNSIKMANGFFYKPAFGCDFTIKDKQSLYVILGYKGMQYQYEAFNTTYGNAGNEIRKSMAGAFCLHIGFAF